MRYPPSLYPKSGIISKSSYQNYPVCSQLSLETVLCRVLGLGAPPAISPPAISRNRYRIDTCDGVGLTSNMHGGGSHFSTEAWATEQRGPGQPSGFSFCNCFPIHRPSHGILSYAVFLNKFSQMGFERKRHGATIVPIKSILCGPLIWSNDAIAKKRKMGSVMMVLLRRLRITSWAERQRT